MSLRLFSIFVATLMASCFSQAAFAASECLPSPDPLTICRNKACPVDSLGQKVMDGDFAFLITCNQVGGNYLWKPESIQLDRDKACSVSEIGQTHMDQDQEHLVTCLRDPSSSAGGIWKRMTSDPGVFTDRYVTRIVTSGHGWDWKYCPEGYLMVAAQISMSDHWEMKCRELQ